MNAISGSCESAVVIPFENIKVDVLHSIRGATAIAET